MDELSAKAKASPRLRMDMDLRNRTVIMEVKDGKYEALREE